MENSKIEWTTHTFNPWMGCTKVSPGCANCYAETLIDHRFKRAKWGKGQPRTRTKPAKWLEPVRWNREAALAQRDMEERRMVSDPRNTEPDIWKVPRPRVFCASLADWLDDEVPAEWLANLLMLIHRTPNLDWLLLTKRPENWHFRLNQVGWILDDKPDSDQSANMLRSWLADWVYSKQPPANVWVGTSVEDQRRADERIPLLLGIPAKVRFLSCEPLLGPVDLRKSFRMISIEPLRGSDPLPSPRDAWHGKCRETPIHWVIAGGESGPGARPMHPDWVRSLRDQCAAAGVPFFFKQWGEWLPICPVYQSDDDDDDPWDGGDPDRQIQLENTGSIAIGEGEFVHGRDYQPDPAKNPWIMERTGKVAAGHRLDDRVHREFPSNSDQ